MDFSDGAEQYNLVFNSAPVAPFLYNPSLVSPGELKSWKDLLHPKWKGKLVMGDPRTPGTAEAIVQFWFVTDSLGKPFIQQFFTGTDVVLSREQRQIVDWVARGQYAIAVAGSSTLATEMRRKGIPIEAMVGSGLQEGTFLATGAAGSISVVEGVPHPNATKVYLNWLLSREGQTVWSRASGLPSRRLDVPTDHIDPSERREPEVSYLETYKERFVRMRADVQEILRTVLPQ